MVCRFDLTAKAGSEAATATWRLGRRPVLWYSSANRKRALPDMLILTYYNCQDWRLYLRLPRTGGWIWSTNIYFCAKNVHSGNEDVIIIVKGSWTLLGETRDQTFYDFLHTSKSDFITYQFMKKDFFFSFIKKNKAAFPVWAFKIVLYLFYFQIVLISSSSRSYQLTSFGMKI